MWYAKCISNDHAGAPNAVSESGRTLLMSGVYLVMCPSCTYSQGLKFGVGAKFSHLKRAVCLIQPEMRSHVQTILSSNGLSETDFGYRFFNCSTCNNLSDGFWVKIENGCSDAYETEFHCSKCGERMEPISEPESIKAFPCPDCHNANLGLIKVMPWDSLELLHYGMRRGHDDGDTGKVHRYGYRDIV